jgi:ribosomal protein S18 acetylase RimI-like enzyme
MSFKIRRAAIQDAAELAYIRINAWNEAYRELLPPQTLEEATRFEDNYVMYQKEILKPGHTLHVALYNNIPIGVFSLEKTEDKDLSEETCELKEIYFLPQYWNKGLGKRTYKSIRKIIKMRGFTNVSCWVYERNTRARHFFETLGFSLEGSKRITEIGIPIEEIRYLKTEFEKDSKETENVENDDN